MTCFRRPRMGSIHPDLWMRKTRPSSSSSSPFMSPPTFLLAFRLFLLLLFSFSFSSILCLLLLCLFPLFFSSIHLFLFPHSLFFSCSDSLSSAPLPSMLLFFASFSSTSLSSFHLFFLPFVVSYSYSTVCPFPSSNFYSLRFFLFSILRHHYYLPLPPLLLPSHPLSFLSSPTPPPSSCYTEALYTDE